MATYSSMDLYSSCPTAMFVGTAPTENGKFLLPPVRYQDMHKICLIIDLDETLVHSSIKQCRLRGASGDWWHSTPGVCPEEALRGRIFAASRRCLRMCLIHSRPCKVCRSCGGPTGQVGCLPGAVIPGVMRLPPGKIRQGPGPAGPGPAPGGDHRQLSCLLRLPPGQCSACGVLVRRHVGHRAAGPDAVLRQTEPCRRCVHGAAKLQQCCRRWRRRRRLTSLPGTAAHERCSASCCGGS
ncbi:uncharacterized protein LOC144132799 isoform X2 [Amblyomma americanum]